MIYKICVNYNNGYLYKQSDFNWIKDSSLEETKKIIILNRYIFIEINISIPLNILFKILYVALRIGVAKLNNYV